MVKKTRLYRKRKTIKKRKYKKQKGGAAKYTAVFIEFRKHKAIAFVLKNLLENLNNDWNLIILHGASNKEYIENIVNTSLQQYKDRITMKMLNKEINKYPEDYNELFYSKEFYDYIPTETFLITHPDSMIIPRNKDTINNFLQYDYVGARSWSILNGGFSLRKKSKMLEILDKCPSDDLTNPEDNYFSNPCDSVNISIPTDDECNKFSSEATWNPNSFGLHAPWKWNDVKIIVKDVPEIQELIDLQGVEL